MTYWLVQTTIEWSFIKLGFWKFVVSTNCDIRYVIKILPKNRYKRLELSLRNARHNWNSNNSENRIGHLLQFPTLTLYNDINLSARFQNYFSHVWEPSDLALLWKIRLKREQNLNHYLLCQIFDKMNYWSFVFLLFFDIQQPIFFKLWAILHCKWSA